MLLKPAGEWNPLDLDDDGQWGDSDDNMSSGANVYATSYNQSNDVLETILSATQYKAPSVTFAYDVAFTKSANEDELFSNIPELETHKFDNYDRFYTSTADGPFYPNYV